MSSSSKTMDTINSVNDSLVEYLGEGDMIFDSKTRHSCKFKISMLMNGIITGDLEFESAELFNPLDYQLFLVVGKININSRKLIASGCYFTRTTISHSTKLAKSIIRVRKLFVSPEGNLLIPHRELLIKAGVVNISKTFRVMVQTPMGILQIAHFKGVYEKFENILKNFESPIISSILELKTDANGTTRLKDIVDRVKEIIDNFLKITSLSQLKNHQTVYYHVYEKTESGGGRLLLSELAMPSIGTTSGPELTNVAHSSEFIKAAWTGFSKSGYTSALEKKYGFDSGLYWLIESATL